MIFDSYMPALPRFSLSAIADLLSQYIIGLSFLACFRSSNTYVIHKAWQLASDKQIYSASAVERGTTCCFFDIHVIALEPMKKTLSEVLLLSSTLSAQSLSQYPITLESFFF